MALNWLAFYQLSTSHEKNDNNQCKLQSLHSNECYSTWFYNKQFICFFDISFNLITNLFDKGNTVVTDSSKTSDFWQNNILIRKIITAK